MRVAIVQMNSGDDPEVNFAMLEPMLEQARADGADLVVLPENFALLGVSPARRNEFAEPDGAGPIQDRIAAYAQAFGLWIVAGTIPIRTDHSDDPQRSCSSCCVYDSDGQRVARYDKIHLFDVRLAECQEVYAESSFTVPGTAPVVVDSPWGRMGLAVCYDLRFPEQFRSMAATGMDLIALPAAFTCTTGQAHWESLLRTRAIENQCCLVAAAQTGEHPDGRLTWGHSMIIDAWGRIQADLGPNISAACVSIDLSAQQSLRQEFPALDHRRPDIFKH